MDGNQYRRRNLWFQTVKRQHELPHWYLSKAMKIHILKKRNPWRFLTIYVQKVYVINKRFSNIQQWNNGIIFILFIYFPSKYTINKSYIYLFYLFTLEDNQNQKHCFEKCANFLRNFAGKYLWLCVCAHAPALVFSFRHEVCSHRDICIPTFTIFVISSTSGKLFWHKN